MKAPKPPPPKAWPDLSAGDWIAVGSLVAAIATAAFAYAQVDVARRTWRDQTLLTRQIEGCHEILAALREFGLSMDFYAASVAAAPASPYAVRGAPEFDRAWENYLKFKSVAAVNDVFFPMKTIKQINELKAEADRTETALLAIHKANLEGTRTPVPEKLTIPLNQKWEGFRSACYTIANPG